jgi:NAD(P)-dependent dehydrogenase (short-subunit alcohol dehydrogenase family)
MPRLQGKRILITGASSGIGLAAVERFAREGADLALVARGDAALAEAAAVAQEHGVAAHGFPADLADGPRPTPRSRPQSTRLAAWTFSSPTRARSRSGTSSRWIPTTSTARWR